MGIAMFLVLGLVVGLISRVFLPSQKSMNLTSTALLAMVGSIVGGTIGSLVSGHSLLDISTASLVGSVVGALGLMGALTFSNHRLAV